MKLYLIFPTILLSLLLPSISSSVDCNQEPCEITAREYWYYAVYDRLHDRREDETNIYGLVYGHHGPAQIKIQKIALQNRQDKEDAYIEIIDKNIYQLNRDPSIFDRQKRQDSLTRVITKYIHRGDHYKSIEISPNFMHVASTITDKDFETAQEWIDWWMLNRHKVSLSDDGTILVTQASSKGDKSKQIIAKVGLRIISYDEIIDEGEDQYARNREIKELNKILEEEVINLEIWERKINPRNDGIERMIMKINQEEWKGLEELNEHRIKILKERRVQMLVLIEALEIWQEDQEKGDDFAKSELEPLGINQLYWEWVKTESNNPEYIERLYIWKDIEDITPSNLNELQLRFDRDRLVKQAKERLKMEKLKMQVVPNYLELNEADREYEFKVWLRKKMAEKTVIYDDNYKLALEID